MIKWIHGNKHSITVFIIASIVVFSMSIFGIDMPGNRADRYAIKIGDETVSYEEFQTEKRQRQEMLIAQYKRILGDNFSKFADQIYNMPNQTIADDIISKKLLLKEAEELNLHVGNGQVEKVLKQDVFGGNFNPENYKAYLLQTGQSAAAFESKLSKEILIENYKELLTKATKPTKQEINNFIKTKETAYDIKYASFSPSNYAKDVKVEDSELEKFYTANQTDYEVPAKITYNFIELSPENNKDLIIISDDDLMLYYSENESKYMDQEQAKLKQIQINIPKDATEEKQAEIKNKAEEAHSKASAGENFDLLVSQYSEDFLSVAKQGDIGWVEKGKREKSFNDAVFASKNAGVRELIKTSDAFYIVKVDEYKERQAKKFEEVKELIKTELTKREAPSLIAAKAYETFETWNKSEKSLEEIAKESNLKISKQDAPLQATQDPNPKLVGLTNKLITAYNLKKQIVDQGDSTILAEVVNYEEAKILSFEEAKDKVTEDYKSQEAVKIAQKAGEDFLEKIKAQESFDFTQLAKNEKLKLEEKAGLTRAKNEPGIFSNSDFKNLVFKESVANQKPTTLNKVGSDYYIVQVTKITPPDEKAIEEKFDTYKSQAEDDYANSIIQANINRLKSLSEIDINNNLLGDTSVG